LGLPAEEIVEAWHVSSSLLTILGGKAVLGRVFARSEDDPVEPSVMLLSYECWRGRYGGDPDIIGKEVTLSLFAGEPRVRRVVGVMSPGVALGDVAPEYFLPIGERVLAARRGGPAFRLVGRIATGVSIREAAAVAERIVPATLPGESGTYGRVVALEEDLRGDLAPPAWLLATTAAMLLLVACTSDAGLFLGDARARRTEISIRMALGASPRSVAFQLIVEHGLKVLVASVGGIVGAMLILKGIGRLAPPEIMGGVPLLVGRPGLLVGVGLAATTIVAFGLLPVCLLLFSKGGTADLRSRSAQGLVDRTAQRLVVALQLAMAMVMVVCGLLLGAAFGDIRSRELGFVRSNLTVASFRPTVPPDVVAQDGAWPLYSTWLHTDALLEGLRQLPGVIDAAAVTDAPLGSASQSVLLIDRGPSSSLPLDADFQIVTETYFNTMQVPLRVGRLLGPSDRQKGSSDSVVAALVSEELANRFGPDFGIGSRLSLVGSMARAYEVVGVVGNVRQRGFKGSGLSTIYVISATYNSARDLVVRTDPNVGTAALPIREAVQRIDPATLVGRIETMDSKAARSLAGEQFRAALAATFGVATLVLAVCGVHLHSAMIVGQRRTELGIRLALGASRLEAVGLVVREVGHAAGLGVLIGLPGSILASVLLHHLLVGVSPLALSTHVGSIVLLASGIFVGALVPTLKASRINPTELLRIS
jgi:putative ABC transport system permease protein